MVLVAPIVFITPINNQLLWFFTSLNAAEVTASTLYLQLSPSPAYALITICILSFQPGKSMSTLTMPLFEKVTGFCTSTFLTCSKGKLKQALEEVIKICKEVYLFLRLWQVFCNGTEIVPQKFKRFESSRCWNPIPYMDSLMGPSRMEIVVLA